MTSSVKVRRPAFEAIMIVERRFHRPSTSMVHQQVGVCVSLMWARSPSVPRWRMSIS